MPTVVSEIVSDATRKTDLSIKLRDYDATPRLQHYVLIAQTESLVFVCVRGAAGGFSLHPKEWRHLPETVELSAIRVSLSLAETCEGLTTLTDA